MKGTSVFARRKSSTMALYVAAGVAALIWLIPFLGVFMASIRPLSEISRGWWRFEQFSPTLRNYVGAWNHPAAPLGKGMLNSLRVAVPATILPLVIASIAAYGFARFRFRLRDLLFMAIVALMTLPQQMIAVPIYRIMRGLGAVDSYTGLVLVHAAWGLPWIMYFMRNYFTTVPIEVEEAAK
ncbi:MAG: carbohydrate ABC transporter permease, partial [Firmicutes bacterium]|nr:carbohydrate ABC transporter permease [Bacillota bacterium]